MAVTPKDGLVITYEFCVSSGIRDGDWRIAVAGIHDASRRKSDSSNVTYEVGGCETLGSEVGGGKVR